jgi:hypothetical protein
MKFNLFIARNDSDDKEVRPYVLITHTYPQGVRIANILFSISPGNRCDRLTSIFHEDHPHCMGHTAYMGRVDG